MKTLSIQQPWAWLITNGFKNIENRSWYTKFRGRIYIHASKAFDYEGYNQAAELMQSLHGITIPTLAEYDRGGIVGSATIVACVRSAQSPWFSGPYGFVLRDAEVLPFKACRGRLGFFEV